MLSSPPLTEAQFQAQVTQYAELCGWEWVHCRAGRTVDSWRTPMSGTMAKGWPDLVLVRARDRRLIFAELKRDSTTTTEAQGRVLDTLRSIEHYPTPIDMFLRQKPPIAHPSIEVHVWRPKDWDLIERKLR